MREHGLKIDGWSLSHARNMLTFHMFFGMCVSGHGEKCRHIGGSLNQSSVVEAVFSQLTVLCHASPLNHDNLRFICNAIAVKLPTAVTPDDMLHAISCAVEAPRNKPFDILEFLGLLENVSKPTLFKWCSSHGIYPEGSVPDVKKRLLTHVFHGDCRTSNATRFHACRDVCIQGSHAFSDADKAAFLPSIVCLSSEVGVNTMKLIAELVTGASCTGLSRTAVRAKLRNYIFRMRRGKAIYHTVVRQMCGKNPFTQLNRIRNTWPEIAESSLKNSIRSLFEDEVKRQCNVRQVCASCSTKYSAKDFVTVSTSDIDLHSVLQIPVERADRRIDMLSHGPLANLLLDPKGVLDGTAADSSITLCHDCHYSLTRKRMPKFALANHLNVGEIPDVLRGLSAVEESMIALCRSRCIMVQLQSIRGGCNSQRGYKGHTIFHEQDTGKMATLLPPSIEDILTPICVLFIGSTKPTMCYELVKSQPSYEA